jgi:hypothetical protein
VQPQLDLTGAKLDPDLAGNPLLVHWPHPFVHCILAIHPNRLIFSHQQFFDFFAD